MKSLFLVVSLLTSFAGLANSARIGDSIVLSGNINGGAVQISANYVTFQNNTMLQRSETLLNGASVGVEDTWLAEEDILTPESAGLMVALCPNIGGTQEYLNLPVGRTLTCRLETQSLRELPYALAKNLQALGDLVWLAPFPVLGIAQIQVNGSYLKVQSYNWN